MLLVTFRQLLAGFVAADGCGLGLAVTVGVRGAFVATFSVTVGVTLITDGVASGAAVRVGMIGVNGGLHAIKHPLNTIKSNAFFFIQQHWRMCAKHSQNRDAAACSQGFAPHKIIHS